MQTKLADLNDPVRWIDAQQQRLPNLANMQSVGSKDDQELYERQLLQFNQLKADLGCAAQILLYSHAIRAFFMTE